MKKRIFVIAIFLLFNLPTGAWACDDALVMLLTAQNPKSEFSVAIRAFTGALTVLGTSLKYEANPPFDEELKEVMTSWLNLSQRYMTNPPSEAKNDRKWVSKMSNAAKFIGQVRRFVAQKEYMAAHDKILELSAYLGVFFEAFGVSEEKQMFIRASSLLMDLQRFVLAKNFEEALVLRLEVENVIKEFDEILPKAESAKKDYEATVEQQNKVFNMIIAKENYLKIDEEISQLQVYAEQLRSLILMQEWFPGALDQEKE